MKNLLKIISIAFCVAVCCAVFAGCSLFSTPTPNDPDTDNGGTTTQTSEPPISPSMSAILTESDTTQGNYNVTFTFMFTEDFTVSANNDNFVEINFYAQNIDTKTSSLLSTYGGELTSFSKNFQNEILQELFNNDNYNGDYPYNSESTNLYNYYSHTIISRDDDGIPIQSGNENGDLLTDEDGAPIYETETLSAIFVAYVEIKITFTDDTGTHNASVTCPISFPPQPA